MYDFDRQTRGIVLLKLRVDSVFLADENDGNAVLSGRLYGAVDFNGGRVIPAHRIDCDFEIRHEELFLGGFDDFPVFVMAAVRTRAVRHAQLVTVRALGK